MGNELLEYYVRHNGVCIPGKIRTSRHQRICMTAIHSDVQFFSVEVFMLLKCCEHFHYPGMEPFFFPSKKWTSSTLRLIFPSNKTSHLLFKILEQNQFHCRNSIASNPIRSMLHLKSRTNQCISINRITLRKFQVFSPLPPHSP